MKDILGKHAVDSRTGFAGIITACCDYAHKKSEILIAAKDDSLWVLLDTLKVDGSKVEFPKDPRLGKKAFNKDKGVTSTITGVSYVLGAGGRIELQDEGNEDYYWVIERCVELI